MAFSIKDPKADELARQLASETGESLTRAVLVALRERLDRVRAGRSGRRLVDQLDDIARRCADLPVRDGRTAGQILDYDERGLPR